MTQLIINHFNNSHLKIIRDLWSRSEKILIAVAYVRMSGLHNLSQVIEQKVSENVPQTIICSLDFGLSESEALYILHSKLEIQQSSGLYLAKQDQTFHPKLYMFKINSEYHIIVGSANFTHGGLDGNIEASIYSVVSQFSELAIDTLDYFKYLRSKDYSVPANWLNINQYAGWQKKQERNRKKYQRRKPSRAKEIYPFDYDSLKLYFKEYQVKKNIADESNRRNDSYKKAHSLLDYIATSAISESEFRISFENLACGKKRLLKSNGLCRHKPDILVSQNDFIELVRYVRENQDLSPIEIFKGGKRIIERKFGAGINFLTEIMIAYQPDKFANLNKNQKKALKLIGVSLKSLNSFKGKDYQDYCSLIAEIKNTVGLKNNIEI